MIEINLISGVVDGDRKSPVSSVKLPEDDYAHESRESKVSVSVLTSLRLLWVELLS